jgi:hypothetical protein
MRPWLLAAAAVCVVALGDTLSVEYRSSLGVHSTSGHLRVERGDGTLLAWLATDGLDGFDAPAGIDVESEGNACSYDTRCGTVELDGLRVGVFSQQVLVPYGASVEVGDYVVQGAYSRLTESRCPEQRSGNATIAVYARPAAVADAGAGGP